MKTKITQLIVPILIEQTFIMLLGVVNIIMAGHLGKEVLSAIGMIDAINNVFIAFFSAIAIGGTVIIARNVGAGKESTTQNTAINALITTFLISLLPSLLLWLFKTTVLHLLYGTVDSIVQKNAVIYFNITLFTYPLLAITFMIFGILRGVGNTKTPMKISVFMNIVNVLCGYVLIFGLTVGNANFSITIPSLGILGAALSIAIARSSGAFLALVGLLRHVVKMSFAELRQFQFDSHLLKQVFGIGIPSGLESLIFNAGKLVLQTVVVSFGTISIASSTILWSLFGLMNIPGVAIAIASPTLVSQAIGRQDFDGARKTLFSMAKLTIIMQLIMSLPFALFARQLVQLFTQEADVIALTTKILYTLILCIPLLWANSFVIPQGLKGGGDVKFTLVISLLSMWSFRIGLGYVLGSFFGLQLLGLWIAMYFDWIFRGLLFTFRLKGKKWIHS
jgi:putative MATE family efflux protein